MGYQRKPGQVRIIGGRWRGRKVQFLERPDLRPTPDRVRETLFNWLAPVVTGARCLDLFAGSGVLGIEALSRGAQHVVMVDADPQVAAMLQQQLRRLDCDEAQVSVKDGLAYLRGPPRGFDIVFLDPPYASGLLGPCCDLLEARQWLAPEARIYLEIRRRTAFPELPENWSVVRSKHAGQVTYCLALREQATD